jgi:ATP-dependent Clp protease ATP-binding subunit ClpC
MFDNYTEKARRSLFFSRYEASLFGSPIIESQHLLLGMLREDKGLENYILHFAVSAQSIRDQVDAHTTIREIVSTSVDLPMSQECKRILNFAAEESTRLEHQHIGTEHLLLGILREHDCYAARVLRERGISADRVRSDIQSNAQNNAT